MRRRLFIALVILLLLGVAGALAYVVRHQTRPPVPPPSAAHLVLRDQVMISRDELGVPHIYGRTDAAAAFGLAYAHAEDDFPTILGTLAAARGQLSRIMPGQLSAANDFMVQLFDVSSEAQAQYAALPPPFRAYLDAYAEGLNYYATQHADEVDSRFLPMRGQDIIAGFVHKLPLMMGVGEILQNLVSFTPQQLQVGQVIEHRFDKPSQLPEWFTGRLAGSNAHAVARSRSSDDITRLNINSHQPWEGPVAWYEAHIMSDEGLNAMGSTFPGAPVILHGHNAHLGWAHTVNRPDIVDVYKLTVRETPQLEYQLDGRWLPLQQRDASINFDLGVFDFSVDKAFYLSEHGPVVKTAAGYFAIRFPGRSGMGKAAYQWYLMDRASSLAEWQEAMRLQHISMMNTVYADRDNIFYVYNALLPIRPTGPDWRAILPGDDSALIWHDTLDYDKLPQVLNPRSGLVLNTNTTPFLATDGPENPRPENFAASFGIERTLNNRGLRSFETFGRDGHISREAFLRYKFDRRYSRDSELFREVLTPLIEHYTPFGADEASALDLLRAWDGEMAPASTAASLVRLIEEPWYRARLYQPVHTPVPAGEMLFRAAVRQLRADFARIDVPLERLQKLRRGSLLLGLGGGSDTLQSVHTAQQGRWRVGTAGDSYIMLVEFDGSGAHSWSRHQYGNVNRPDSPHFADQAEAFQARTLRSTHFTLDEVRQAAKQSYHPGELATR